MLDPNLTAFLAVIAAACAGYFYARWQYAAEVVEVYRLLNDEQEDEAALDMGIEPWEVPH